MDDKAIDRRRHNFTIIDNEAIDLTRKIGSSALAVYCVLVRMSNGDNKCFPGQKYLSDATRLCQRTIRTSIAALEEHGLISVKKSAGFQSTYTILPVKKTANKKDTQAIKTEVVGAILPGGAIHFAGGVRQNSTSNNTNITREEQQDAQPSVKSEMPIADQVLLPIFQKIASALSQPDLPPLTERLQALRRAAQNVHVGGYDNIVRAAKNLARSPETDSHKTYDWLLSRWDNDNVRRITSFMHGKREAKKVDYVDAPEEWKKRYAESTPR